MTHVVDHPQRELLHQEVHARPPLALWPNERVVAQAFLFTSADQRLSHQRWIESVTRALGAKVHPAFGQSLRVLELAEAPQRLLLKWEMHGEFCSVTLYAQQDEALEPRFQESRRSLISRTNARLRELGAEILAEQPGERIAALDIFVRRHEPTDDAAQRAGYFRHNTLVGSKILATQRAQVWADFQLDEDGFDCFLVDHQGMGSRQTGRVVQRLIDMDTYRMMSMLALPRAKSLGEPLRKAERELTELTAKIAQAASEAVDQRSPQPTDDRLLKGLSVLAARVEEWVSEVGLRFTASEAYAELVRRALAELRETPITGLQTFTEFMDRRFEPAMRTCNWTQRRLREMSDRVTRATSSLRTRVEFVNERTTHALLMSMDRRAKLQLKLQQTVEGLSIVVLTYYATGLIGYLAKGAKSLGATVSPDLITAAAVPVVAGLLYFGVKKARPHLHQD